MDRIQKVNSLIFHELNTLLARKLEEKDKEKFLLSFTKVEVGRDLRHARVFFLAYPPKFKGQAHSFLMGQRIDWQNTLNKKLTLKCKPKLDFIFDKGQENAFLVEEILKKM